MKSTAYRSHSSTSNRNTGKEDGRQHCYISTVFVTRTCTHVRRDRGNAALRPRPRCGYLSRVICTIIARSPFLINATTSTASGSGASSAPAVHNAVPPRYIGASHVPHRASLASQRFRSDIRGAVEQTNVREVCSCYYPSLVFITRTLQLLGMRIRR
jgi:hypothetical protein